jgi:prepilin-type N-terminal cleavage/methylation domain-containing protein
MKIKLKKQKGFSLLELIIAIFIFSVVMLAVVAIFSKTIGSYKNSRNLQRNLENAQFALNLMAKTIRESKMVIPASPSTVGEIKMINKRTTCKAFNFNSTEKTLQSSTFTSNDCSGSISYSTAVSNVYDVKFFVTPSSSTAPKQVGHMTILMRLCSDQTCTSADEHALQTSVSLRNFSQ